jgi:hypothetical protein
VRVLDLFCGSGGAGEGYARAGYEVTGVDIDPRSAKDYAHVGTFVHGDALEYLTTADLSSFDLIHASPPCQTYSTGVYSRSSKWNRTKGLDEPSLIGPTLDALRASGLPWVLENVAGARAAMPPDSFELCGSMFGLPIPRHRVFATSHVIYAPAHPDCSGLAKRSAEWLGYEYRDMSVTGKGRRAGTAQRWAQLLDVHHPMSQHGLAESIPPRYTEYVGLMMQAAVLPRVGGLW